MPLPGLGRISQKNTAKYWQPFLLEAQDALWKQEIDRAGALFQEIIGELNSIQKSNGLNDELSTVYVDATLGFWAVNYLKNPNYRSYYRTLVNKAVWQQRIGFIARVFAICKDVHPEALMIYKEFIRRKPTESNVRAAKDILRTASYSLEAFDLLEFLVRLTSDDVDITMWYCRWAIKAQRMEAAEQAARKVLDRFPEHPEAHRCLGYLAEMRQEWLVAADHYSICAEWLRQAVCLNHAGQYDWALNALERVNQLGRKDLVWLYHAGWANLHAGNIERGLQYWQELRNNYPAKAKIINEQLAAIEYQECRHQLDNPAALAENQKIELFPQSLRVEALKRAGATQFLLYRKPKVAEEMFHKAAMQSPKDPILAAYYLASKASQKNDPSLDKTFFELLQKFFAGGGLYLFLRGLWLLPEKPHIARKYFLETAKRYGASQFLPTQAIEAAVWLSEQLSNQPDQMDEYPFDSLTALTSELQPFVEAMRSSQLIRQMRANIRQPALLSSASTQTQWISPVIIRRRVQTLYWAFCGNWLQAMEDAKGDAELEQHLQMLFDQHKDSLLKQWWQAKHFAEVEEHLLSALKAQPGDTRCHHNLAIFYTRWAIESGSGGKDKAQQDSLWKQAIGHWAVTLTDTSYWNQWKKLRAPVYEGGLDEVNVALVMLETIPEMLQAYFNGREANAEALEADQYHYYTVLLDEEINATKAARRLIAACSESKTTAFSSLRCWISPGLTKIHSSEKVIKKLLRAANDSRLSKADARTLQLAFSPLGEIHLLAACGQFKQAIEQLANLEASSKNARHIRKLHEERAIILEKYIRSLLKANQWQEAEIQAKKLMFLRPKQKGVEDLYVEVCVEWVKHRLQEEQPDLEKNVLYLKEVKKRISTTSTTLDGMLAETLIRWGYEAMKNEQENIAQKRFEEAMKLSPDNSRAREGMAEVYLHKAVKAYEQHRYADAFDLGGKMYHFSQTVRTATLYATLAIDYAVSQAKQNYLRSAIDTLTPILKLPYDRNDVEIHPLLSGLWNDYGVQLFHEGDYYAGIRAFKTALEYDPDNHAALRNLSYLR